MVVDVTGLPRIELFSDAFLQNPDAVFAPARERSWLGISARGYEVLRYEPAQRLLRDPRFGHDQGPLMQAIGIAGGPVYDFRVNFIMNQDGATHARLRRSVARFFGPAYIERMREVVRGIVNDLLDRINPSQPVDLFREVCEWIPARLYCVMVAAPEEDAPFVRRISDMVLKLFRRDPQYREQIERGYAELFEYADARVAERRGALGNDVLSHLIRHEQKGDLSHRELIHQAVTLLEASTDNTSHQMGFVIGLLLDHRRQWEQLVNDQSLVPAAVEEGIRYRPKIFTLDRVAREHVVVDGLDVPAGTLLNVSLLSAQYDPDAYPDPHRYDITRQDPLPVLEFGGGPHVCLGAGLARAEMQEVVSVLASRFPRMELAEPVRWHIDTRHADIDALPVILDPR